MTSISGNSTLGIALSGIQRNLKSISENAQKISNLSTGLEGDGDIVGPMIELKQDIRGVQALRKVVDTVSELEDETLKIIA